MDNKNQPLVPCTMEKRGNIPDRFYDDKKSQWTYTVNGLTKREYFAGLAMQGYVTSLGLETSTKDVAKWAVEMADALLEELAKTKTE